MPFREGTGPQGKRPRAGRGSGQCRGQGVSSPSPQGEQPQGAVPGSARGQKRGRGRGRRSGLGR